MTTPTTKKAWFMAFEANVSEDYIEEHWDKLKRWEAKPFQYFLGMWGRGENARLIATLVPRPRITVDRQTTFYMYAIQFEDDSFLAIRRFANGPKTLNPGDVLTLGDGLVREANG